MRTALIGALLGIIILSQWQGGACRYVCTPYGPYWHCDERQGPSYPPNQPPPRCS